jgi:Uncharacterized conserved protein
MSWIWAVLAPHPPIIVPDVGRGREREAALTIEGIDGLTRRIAAAERPERILLLSPHQPYALGSLALNRARAIRGSFSPFGAPSVVFDLRTPLVEVDALYDFLGARNVPVSFVELHDLTRDQGAMVPLYFLENALNGLPQTTLGNAVGMTPEAAFQLGRALAAYDDGMKWGLVASGDLSHRLTPDAPAGYSPHGEAFDRAVVQALERTDPAPLLELSPRVREDAGECGLRSIMTLLGLCAELGAKIDVLSYEGPFGVGYCNAGWIREGAER